MINVPSPVSEFVQSAITMIAYLLPIILPVIIGAVIVWVKARWESILASQPENVRLMIEAAAKFGADFAEKVGPSLELEGKEKLEAALNAAEGWLKAQGYDVELDVLVAAIEGVLFNNPDDYPSSHAEG